MGGGFASLEDQDDQVEFFNVWNEATADERQKMGVRIGKKTSQLMKNDTLSAKEIRTELARYVKSVILGKPARGKAKRKR